MNTEFPRRLPTVQNTNRSVATTTSKTSTSEEDHAIQKQILDVIKNAFTTLNNLTDKVYNFVDKHRQDRAREKKEKEVKAKAEEKSAEGGKSGDKKPDDNTNPIVQFGKKILDVMSRGIAKYKEGIGRLQSTVENVNGSVGNAIGGVFGSGLFGSMLSGIITKSLNFVVSKVIIGAIFGNPVVLAIAAGVATIIWLCIKYWTEIKEVLNSVWGSIKDIYEWVKGIFHKDKASKAKEYIAEDMVVPKNVIETYYGTDEAGKKKMQEDAERAKVDPEFNAELMKTLKNAQKEQNDRFYENIERMTKGYAPLPVNPATEINQTYINNNYGIDPYGFGGTIDDLMATGYMPYSPIVNTVNNNTAVETNTFDNVSEAYPSSIVSTPFPTGAMEPVQF